MERIFAKKILREFWEIYPDSEQYLKTWYDTAMNANWQNPAEVKKTRVLTIDRNIFIFLPSKTL